MQTQTTTRTPIELGTTVYGSDGEKIGDVAEIQSNYIVIEKGFIFTKDLYIPMATIASQDADGVRLSMTKNEVENHDWSTPPPLYAEKDDLPANDRPESPAPFGEQHTDPVAGHTGDPVIDRDILTGERREEKLDEDNEPR
jgi:hypothetical protein